MKESTKSFQKSIDDNSLSVNEVSKITKEVWCVFIESRSSKQGENELF